MENNKSVIPRSRFLVWGSAMFASIALFKFLLPASREKIEKPETVKMLGEDGKLVEVDISRIKETKRKITDDELLSWIKK